MVHRFLREQVKPGAFCIDATAGRGRDTALLCQLAGPAGRVIAMDIQQEAVDSTKQLLADRGLTAEVLLADHARLRELAEEGTVDCIVFNFGRLPGGDPKLVTKKESSVAAVEAALGLLKPGGVLALALYYGKENGYEEKAAVEECLARADSRKYSVLQCQWSNRPGDPPEPIFVWREKL